MPEKKPSPNLVPESIVRCGTCGYDGWRDGYPCNRCGGLEPIRYVPEDEVERLRKRLREAVDLLDNARCDLRDPSLRRSWGARRRALRDA